MRHSDRMKCPHAHTYDDYQQLISFRERLLCLVVHTYAQLLLSNVRIDVKTQAGHVLQIDRLVRIITIITCYII
jgi:hypothetical protein